MVFNLLTLVSRLDVTLQILQSFSTKVAEVLRDDTSPVDERTAKNLSLYLVAEYTFDEFIMKLDAINSIYIQLAQIMNVSVTEHPIQVRKVEAGSIWLDILGYPKIIELM